jgi:hypothetical protein
MEGTVEVGDGLEIAFDALRLVICVTLSSFGWSGVPGAEGR